MKRPPEIQPDRELWESVWERARIERPVQTHILRAIDKVTSVRGKDVLEVGCGSGVNSVALMSRGANVVALDYSLHALRHTQHNAQIHSVKLNLAAGDLFRLPFADASFDIVFSQGLMEHFLDPMPGLIEQLRIVRPGGFLCVDVPQTWSLGTVYKRWHMRRGTWFAGWETSYSLPVLEALMREAGSEVVHSYGWLYFPAFVYGIRNLHTLNERHNLPFWLSQSVKARVEDGWCWVEKQRWYYRWLGCIGVIGRKPLENV